LRFITLSSLRRRVPVKPGGVDGQPLPDEDWGTTINKIEDLLLEIYHRRLETTTRAEAAFRKHGYDWKIQDAEKRVFLCSRAMSRLPAVSVLSHCSIHDVTWIPALETYERYLVAFPGIAQINHKVCIYDRERALSDVEIETIYENLVGTPFILARGDELPLLLTSNFTSLG
jgi:hypothetical protein